MEGGRESEGRREERWREGGRVRGEERRGRESEGGREERWREGERVRGWASCY